MRTKTWAIVILIVGLSAMAVYGAGSTTKPSTRPSTRLFAPYSKMTSLSDEQKRQIEVIHRKVLADEKEIEAKQKVDIMALLTDDQKKEIRDIEDKTTADRKAKAAAKKDAT